MINMNKYNDIPDWLGYCPQCPECGGDMGYSYLDSEFKCSECGEVFDDQDFSEEEYGDLDPDDPPYSCVACGGPWPSCKSSCQLFDE